MRLDYNKSHFIGCDSSYKECDIMIFGAPFDGTSSYRAGSRFAPSAIRGESYSIETYSPYQDKDITDIKVYDMGDLDLPYGNASRCLNAIEKITAKALADNKKPIMIGGEHLVSLGGIKAAFKKYPDLCIIHFDAHADVRDDYMGEKLSHATVIKRAWELTGDDRIYQFGIRSGEKQEFEWAKQHTQLNKFNFNGLDAALDKLYGKPIYLTIDLDVLDPSFFPGTGTPESGGVSFLELLGAINKVLKLNVVACDVNELCPPYDLSGASTSLACKLLREIMLGL